MVCLLDGLLVGVQLRTNQLSNLQTNKLAGWSIAQPIIENNRGDNSYTYNGRKIIGRDKWNFE